jgi:predicted DNA-binding transcriptional regulator YafY
MLPLVGTQFWIGIESFWNKVGDQLPSAVWEHYERYRRTMYVLGLPFKTYEKHQGILKTVNRAIQEHRLLEMEYQVPGRPASTRVIEPYAVVLYQSSIYVVAVLSDQEGETAQIRHWKLDRFQTAKALDKWFKPDQTVDLSQHLGQSVGIFSGAQTQDYVIRLSPQAARWIEEDPWHPEQKIEPDKDGHVILTVKAFHDTEIIQRVMRLGMEAELLAPDSCRAEIARIVKELSQRYES